MDGIGEVHEMPLSAITRPLMPTVCEGKVDSLVATLQAEAAAGTTLLQSKVPPVTVLWITGREGGNYYFGFGGCHRYHAFKKLGRATIPAVLQVATIAQLRDIMGASTPDLK